MNRSNWFAIGIISFVWLIGAFGFYHFGGGDVSILFLSINALGVVIASYLSIISSAQNIAFKRVENAYELCQRWDHEAMMSARTLLRSLMENRRAISDTDLVAKIDNDPILQQSVISLFNFWQDIYLAVTHKRADARILKDAFRGVFHQTMAVFGAWIKYDTNLQRDPLLLKQLEDLEGKWK